MTLRHLHIPKTGGSAIRWALRYSNVGTEPIDHSLRLCDLAPDEEAIVAVRDPVARFVSAYDGERRLVGTVRVRWPTVDDAAQDIPALIEHYKVWKAPYPLVYWLHDAATVARKVRYLLHTERLDEGWDVVRREQRNIRKLPQDGHRNNHELYRQQKSRPSAETIATLRDFYAADYELLEAIA